MKAKFLIEDRTVCNIQTYIKIDDVECEIEEMLDLINKLEIMDVPVGCSKLCDKLIKLEVAVTSTYCSGAVTRSKNFESFASKIQAMYNKKQKSQSI